MLPSCVLETLMIVERKAVAAALTIAGLEAVKMAAVVVPVLAGAGIVGILWGSVLHAVLRLVVMAWYLRRVSWPLAGPSWETMRRHWRYATPLGVAALIGLIQVSADQYAVSAMYDAAVYAVYAVGLFQLPIVALVGTVTASTFMVELADLRKTGEGAPLELWHRVTTRLAAVCFPVCAFAVVWAPDVITVLFTDTYRASIPIFQVVSFGALLTPLLTDAVLRVYADTPWILRVNAIKLVFTAILVPAAVGWGSLAGVALVGVLIMTIGKGLMLKRIAERFHVRAGGLLPWTALALVGVEAVVCVIPAVWASRAWGASPVERLVIGLVVYSVAYAAVLATDRAVRGLGYAERAVAGPSVPNEREVP
jgi:O-antigen/teichoic acid export membrane protein